MQPETLYHIFNRGNNQQPIFFSQENYFYFLRKVQRHLMKHVDLFAYCLMPNHFHFMVFSKEDIVPPEFSNDLKIMLRSYTRAVNKQENRTGSLFQQNTKIKSLEEDISHGMTRSHAMTTSTTSNDYPLTCFHYIHQNPMKAGLAERMEDYEMSSFRDYAGLREESLCNKSLASKLLDLPEADKFLEECYRIQTIRKVDDHQSHIYNHFKTT